MHSATNFLRTARKVLTEDSIETDYTRTFDVLTMLGDCEYSAGKTDDAEQIFTFLRDHARNKPDLVRVLLIEAAAYESSGKLQRSFEKCVEAMRAYDVIVPENVSDEEALSSKNEVLDLVYQLTSRLERGKKDLKHIAHILPKMDDQHEMMMEALYTMIPISYIVGRGRNNFYFGIALACKFTFIHGASPFSANACACFSGMIISCFYFIKVYFIYFYLGALSNAGQWEESYQFAKLAKEFQEVCPHPQSLPRVELNVEAFGQWQQETLFECKVSLDF